MVTPSGCTMILGGSGTGVAGTSSSPSPVVSLSMFPLPAELAGDWEGELRLRSFMSGLRLLDLRSSGDP
eukprot:9247705-Pyramimonas_sp.AAC.1